MNKFSRIKQTALSVLIGSAIGASVAHAAPVSLPQNISPGFGSTLWQITDSGGTDTNNPFTGNCSGPGLNIQDATSAGGDSDAFDHAYSIWINGVVFVPPATVDLTGTTLTAGPVSMSGLNVTVQYWFDTASAVARVLVTLQNPTGSDIATTVQIPVNFGSDGSTIYEATSSGDTSMTTADIWAVTSQGGTGEYNTTVVPGTSAVQTTVFNCTGTEGIGSTYNVSVPAGQSRSIMMFAGLGSINNTTDSLAGAIAAAPLFNTLDSVVAQGWTAGMSAQQLAEVVNWGPYVAPTPTSIPTLSEWGMILLSSFLAVGTIVTLRRQRQ
ncbi:MAG: IPTL-CTERM sorting domain-containing protein [Thiobacillus sp.]|nr:IPTL-CTERM sorting domain-containing protein [Thiobacillus sp.]